MIQGSFPLLASNTATTFGTTKVIRPHTIAKHMMLNTMGYSMAAMTFWRMPSRLSV